LTCLWITAKGKSSQTQTEKQMRTPEETQRPHGERVEARQRERADTPDLAAEAAREYILAEMLLDLITQAIAGDETNGSPSDPHLRAIPGFYHAQFRDGADWRTVHSSAGHPIAYATSEAALRGAERAKKHLEDRR
jgi:hypothetical protein